MSGQSNKDKQALRAEAKSRARRLAQADISEALTASFLERFRLDAPEAISGFAPLADEPNVMPLLANLHERGWTCCLPVVQSRNAPLVFRRWQPGDTLQRSEFGAREPDSTVQVVEPHILLVPLLAFTSTGERLGRGAGFYDRTLQALRTNGSILAVGVAYAEQRLAFLPTDAHDQRLDAVLTERGFEECGKAAP